ncbi:sigma-70 family RNA polymerase sigma factor [Pedobacter sp. PAMC26386]|nr:sigma-70 family RNA polymerase sigma factor [Pedobacter sp. PAMC26386]
MQANNSNNAMSLLDDAELVNQIKQHNKHAFDELYKRFVKTLTGYGLRLTDDIQIIEDSLHDVFVWIWTNRHKFEIQYSLKSYLIKSVRTTIIHKLKKEQKNVSTDFVDTEEELLNDSSSYNSVESEFILKESHKSTAKMVLAMLETLSPKQKELIHLRYYQELSFKEIASLLNISIKGCYKLMARAIDGLRQKHLLILFLLWLYGVITS